MLYYADLVFVFATEVSLYSYTYKKAFYETHSISVNLSFFSQNSFKNVKLHLLLALTTLVQEVQICIFGYKSTSLSVHVKHSPAARRGVQTCRDRKYRKLNIDIKNNCTATATTTKTKQILYRT